MKRMDEEDYDQYFTGSNADKASPVKNTKSNSKRGSPWAFVVGLLGLTICLLLQTIFYTSGLNYPLSIVGVVFALIGGVGIHEYFQESWRNILSIVIVIGVIVLLFFAFKAEPPLPTRDRDFILLFGMTVIWIGLCSYERRGRWF